MCMWEISLNYFTFSRLVFTKPAYSPGKNDFIYPWQIFTLEDQNLKKREKREKRFAFIRCHCEIIVIYQSRLVGGVAQWLGRWIWFPEIASLNPSTSVPLDGFVLVDPDLTPTRFANSPATGQPLVSWDF